MANATIGADFYQALDVQRNFTAQVAFYSIIMDHFAQLDFFCFSQILNTSIRIDTRLLQNLIGQLPSDAVDIGQTNFYALFSRKVYTGQFLPFINAPPVWFSGESALLLLVLRVRADYHDTTLATNDLALLANRFYRRSYFH